MRSPIIKRRRIQAAALTALGLLAMLLFLLQPRSRLSSPEELAPHIPRSLQSPVDEDLSAQAQFKLMERALGILTEGSHSPAEHKEARELFYGILRHERIQEPLRAEWIDKPPLPAISFRQVAFFAPGERGKTRVGWGIEGLKTIEKLRSGCRSMRLWRWLEFPELVALRLIAGGLYHHETKELREALDLIESIDSSDDSLRNALRGQARSSLGWLSNPYRINREVLGEARLENVNLWFVGQYDAIETFRLQMDLLEAIERSIDLPFASRDLSADRALNNFKASLPAFGYGKPPQIWWSRVKFYWSRTRVPNAVGHSLLQGPSCAATMERFCNLRTARHILRAAIGCVMYFHKFGRYPRDLKQLVEAGLLKAQPQDWFSRGSLRYSRSRAQIWTAGWDGKDDGGPTAQLKPEEPDWGVTLPAHRPGLPLIHLCLVLESLAMLIGKSCASSN
jgi:hypothetical protein